MQDWGTSKRWKGCDPAFFLIFSFFNFLFSRQYRQTLTRCQATRGILIKRVTKLSVVDGRRCTTTGEECCEGFFGAKSAAWLGIRQDTVPELASELELEAGAREPKRGLKRVGALRRPRRVLNRSGARPSKARVDFEEPRAWNKGREGSSRGER